METAYRDTAPNYTEAGFDTELTVSIKVPIRIDIENMSRETLKRHVVNSVRRELGHMVRQQIADGRPIADLVKNGINY